jgi:hypothetical protein
MPAVFLRDAEGTEVEIESGLRAGRKHRASTLRHRRKGMGQERLRGNGELYSVTVATFTQTGAKATRSGIFCMREFLAG